MTRIALLIPFLFSNALIAAVIADSAGEFSLTQGQNNWFYGYYKGPFTPVGFTQMTVTNGNSWVVDIETTITPEHYWTTLSSTRAHGNGIVTSGGRTPQEHWAVRRWVSEVTGPVVISGTLLRGQNNTGGNGIVGRIFAGNQEVLTEVVLNTDFLSHSFSIPINVIAGQNIDFALDPSAANDHSDTTEFTAMISDPVPEPATWLMISGTMLCHFAYRRALGVG